LEPSGSGIGGSRIIGFEAGFRKYGFNTAVVLLDRWCPIKGDIFGGVAKALWLLLVIGILLVATIMFLLV